MASLLGYVVDELIERAPTEPSPELFALKLRCRCESCAEAYVIHSVVTSQACPHCGKQKTLTSALWMKLLGSITPGKAITGEEGAVQWEREPGAIACPKCKQPMRPSPSGDQVECEVCTIARSVTSVPPALSRSVPDVVGFLDEDGLWVVARLYDPRRATPDVSRMGMGCGAILLAGVFFHGLVAWALIEGHVTLGLVLALYSALALVSLLVWARQQARLRPLIQKEHEVVARLARHVPVGSWSLREAWAEAEVLDPKKPDEILATARVTVSKERFDELGGEGAYVRAWYLDRRSFVYARPTALVLRRELTEKAAYRA